MAPHDVLEDFTDILALVEHAEDGVHGARADLVSALEQVDELAHDGSRAHALVLPLDRQLVAAEADRAAQPVAEGVEDAVADARELGRHVVGNGEGFLHPTQCRTMVS